MRHVAEGTRIKKPFKPKDRTKKPKNWQEAVRLAVGQRRINAKKAQAKTSWRKNKDGFMITGQDNQPTENQLTSLEKLQKRPTGQE